jgi:taurine dioxygenase
MRASLACFCISIESLKENPLVTVKPIQGPLGAEIQNVSLSSSLTKKIVHEICYALFEYKIVFFQHQELSPWHLDRFGRMIGNAQLYSFGSGLAGFPQITEIYKRETDRMVFGEEWHTDSSYLINPPNVTLVYIIEAPESGGETFFCNAEMAYSFLDPKLEEFLDRQVGVYRSGSRQHSMRRGGPISTSVDGYLEAEHPIVKTHPKTGRKHAYFSPLHFRKFKGVPIADSLEFGKKLLSHMTARKFSQAFKWNAGTIVLWDNRVVIHKAMNNYPNQRRRMYRMLIDGC